MPAIADDPNGLINACETGPRVATGVRARNFPPRQARQAKAQVRSKKFNSTACALCFAQDPGGQGCNCFGWPVGPSGSWGQSQEAQMVSNFMQQACGKAEVRIHRSSLCPKSIQMRGPPPSPSCGSMFVRSSGFLRIGILKIGKNLQAPGIASGIICHTLRTLGRESRAPLQPRRLTCLN